MGLESIGVWLSGLQEQNWRLCLVSLPRSLDQVQDMFRLMWGTSHDFPEVARFEISGSVRGD